MNKNTNKQQNDSLPIKVKFSIGAKLILIIGFLIIMSLGSITLLVSWMVRDDLKITAEDNNFEVNRRSAMQAESVLTGMKINSLMLMQTMDVLSNAEARKTLDMFFESNPDLAFLFFTVPGKKSVLYINRRFFASKEADLNMAEKFASQYNNALRRAASGETLLLNISPWFKIPLIAFLMPSQGGALAVLFSPDSLGNTFGFGTNPSMLIYNSGDVIIHADSLLVREGANFGEMDFIKSVLENKQTNGQVIYTESDITYFGAFTKLNVSGGAVITRIEHKKVFEGINATTRRNIYLTFTVLSISILLVWFFAKSISTPIKALAKAAHAIQGGDFGSDLKNRSMDEIGVLTASFRSMSSALSVFGKFTNKEIAVQAMRGEIKPGGQQKNASIMFTDIRGFTKKSENFTNTFGNRASDKIVHWLNEYFTLMIECVEKTGGLVDKFIGDGLMAHWGTAYSSGTPQKDAVNCVKAALLMRKALFEMNKNRSEDDPKNPPIRIGCGINTGAVTAGQLGSDLRMEYTVIGDPVNLASRTEAFCKPMNADILIAEDTWLLVKDHFITHEMKSVTVKGKEKPVRIFAVINFANADKGPHTITDVRRYFADPASAESKDES